MRRWRMSLKFGILGLLAEQPLHAYAVKARFEDLLGGSWEVNIGQVSTTLQRLERDGLVEPAESRGDRGRLPYRLTDEGRKALEDWLAEPESEPQQLREEIYVKLLLASRLARGGSTCSGSRTWPSWSRRPNRPGETTWFCSTRAPSYTPRPISNGWMSALRKSRREVTGDDDVGGADRGQQDVRRRSRRAARSGRGQFDHRPRRVHRDHGAIGERKVDPAQPGRRARPAQRWPGDRRRRGPGPAQRSPPGPLPAGPGRVRLPVLQPARQLDRAGERAPARPTAEHPTRPGQGPGEGATGTAGHRGTRRPLPGSPVGRPAAAGRDCPSSDQPAPPPARRRTDRSRRHAQRRASHATDRGAQPRGPDRAPGHP